jgi:hypothetical protein
MASEAEYCWGFAVFLEENGDVDYIDDYLICRNAILLYAKGMIGCSPVIESRWMLQHLLWPFNNDEEDIR